MYIIIALFCLVAFQNNCFCSDERFILKSSNFVEIRESPYFIDKTALLFKIMSNEEPLLLTAPLGFGKSTNLDMIRVFLSNTVEHKETQELFSNTIVTKDSNFVKMNLGNYPVIQCSIESTVPATDYNGVVANFRTSLHKAFSQHQYLESSKLLAKSDRDRFKKFVDADSHTHLAQPELSSGLNFLSKILKNHHNKPVILLIDDYDSVIWDSVITESLGIREVLEFYNSVLDKAVNDKENVQKVILTGTSCILFKLLPGLGNIKCVKFLHDSDFEPYFGLTGDEVDYLVDRTVYVNLRVNLTDWYDGYTSPDLSAHIYNTKSLMSFLLLSKGVLTPYWKNLKTKRALRILLEDNVRKNLLLESAENLMFVCREIEEINENVMEGVKKMITKEMWDADFSDLYIHLLMEHGHFTYDKPWERSGYNSSVTFKFTNLDICRSFQNFIRDFIQEMKRIPLNLNIVKN